MLQEQQAKPTSLELTNHIALSILRHLPAMVMMSSPILPISLHMTTKHLPSHREDIAGIPGREPPAPGPASVAGVRTLPSRTDIRDNLVLTRFFLPRLHVPYLPQR